MNIGMDLGSGSDSGKRGDWIFPYAASKLLVASRKKKEFYSSRLTFWSGKKEETIQKIKAEGLDFDESLSDLNSNSYNRQTSVNVRGDLKLDLAECNQKIREHVNNVEVYDTWCQVLADKGESSLDLNYHDWMFFFGGTVEDKKSK